MKNYVQIGNNRVNTKNTVGVKNRTLPKSTLDGKQSLEQFMWNSYERSFVIEYQLYKKITVQKSY